MGFFARRHLTERSIDVMQNKHFDYWAEKAKDPRMNDFIIESAFVDLLKVGGDLNAFFYNAHYSRNRPISLGHPSTYPFPCQPRKRKIKLSGLTDEQKTQYENHPSKKQRLSH
jgi:hypothetical protein